MNIQHHQNLQSLNSFGISAKAKWLAEITGTDELMQAYEHALGLARQPLIIGGGSNILLTRDVDAVLLNRLKGISFEEDGNSVLLSAYSGENWHQLVEESVNRNLWGLENLSLIPGTAGAAPMQNIGAYGTELIDVFEYLDAIELKSGKRIRFSKNECRFGYRSSIFKTTHKHQYFIEKIVLRLSRHACPNLSYWALQEHFADQEVGNLNAKDISRAVISIRQSKLPDPAELGNAGSFFKNPVLTPEAFNRLITQFPDAKYFENSNGTYKVPAAWLIEQRGWKGKQIGQTGCHRKQALVLVNYGQAKGREILDHALHIIEDVKNHFGIELEPEVNII